MSSSLLDEEHQPPEVASLLGGIRPAKKGNAASVHPDSARATAGGGGSNPPFDPEDPLGAEQDPVDEPDQRMLSLGVKVAFGLPSFATSAMYLPTAIHINKFFADTLLVPPGTLALGE